MKKRRVHDATRSTVGHQLNRRAECACPTRQHRPPVRPSPRHPFFSFLYILYASQSLVLSTPPLYYHPLFSRIAGFLGIFFGVYVCVCVYPRHFLLGALEPHGGGNGQAYASRLRKRSDRIGSIFPSSSMICHQCAIDQ